MPSNLHTEYTESVYSKTHNEGEKNIQKNQECITKVKLHEEGG